ncbi:MAG: glutathione transferase GstA [Steroidobacteraceae bacterium]
MKLYYLNGACSLASCISLIEAGQTFEAYAVDRATKKTADGKDFLSFNPKGYVPVLILDNGEMLTENVAVLSYISTLDKSHKLAPEAGTIGFFRVMEWLAYVNSEVHKSHGPLFKPGSTDEVKAAARELIAAGHQFIENSLGDQPFLTGDNFTVADAYLYVTLSWRSRVGVNIEQFPKLSAFYERVRARPSVQKARKDEGLDP